ncbi:type II toxin-antitoxin system RelE/ParE family toxin [Polaribacter butkevichii]|uniref:Plasmid stabilization protein n=1 Tax=Polaribacter butkevichii TaxID=218490 RepID=A0A2P6C9N9_9FLAO|nr:type II toxin-antitoxin system RelE/ParE family toxin [Polaribacter butkevichii]PQJ69646.1 plasmid stabilization protein [Polaribacter butkevichii]
MELEVYWLELAENKLEDIYGYYLIKANKKVAEKLVNGIVDSTIGIEKQPEIGQIEISLKHRKQEFRYLVFRNYKIVYWINYDFNRIEIANVFDTRQDPEKINEIK